MMRDMFGTPIKEGDIVIFALAFGAYLCSAKVLDLDVPYTGRSKTNTTVGIRVLNDGRKQVLPYSPNKFFVLPVPTSNTIFIDHTTIV